MLSYTLAIVLIQFAPFNSSNGYKSPEAGGDKIRNDTGTMTAKFAKSFAESEFKQYRVILDRIFQSNFDKLSDDILLDFGKDDIGYLL